MYAKVVKWIMWALIAISVAILGWGAAVGFTSKEGLPIDIMLYWAYALIVIAIIIILVLGIGFSASNMDKKSLIKTSAILVACAVVVILVAVLAKGSPAQGLVGIEPTPGELKLTDAVITLTYISCGAAIVAIIFSAILGAIRSGK